MELRNAAPLTTIGWLRQQLADLMHLDEHEVLRPPDEAFAFRGQVYGDTETAFEHMTQRFATYGYTASLRDRPGGGHEVIAVKGVIKSKPGRLWLNVVLFVATLFSVLYIGAQLSPQYAKLVEDPESLEALVLPLTHLYWGIPFAGTLLTILLAHELSHYFVARRHGSPVSLPYFIPMPFSIIGTMGAVIVQKAPMRNRKVLFDIGIAGPLGGLVVAIPLLVLGLALSSVGTPPPGEEIVLQEGNSLLYLGLKYLVFGRILPSGGVDVWLHPVAFAAWAGLLVTMVNLIPVGQLDGGHASYALLGRWAWRFGYIAIAAMLGWGGWLLTNGNEAGGFWLAWGFLNMLINPRHPPPLDDSTRPDWRRVALGLVVLAIFILTFMPAPLREIRVY
jgi:membrane-associated protease RseP (regulator of RpoE activity)